MLCLYSFGVLFGLINLINGHYNGLQDQPPPVQNIDELLEDYLRTENSLWNIIRSSNRDSNTNNICETHKKFMGKNFGEIGLLRSVKRELSLENRTLIDAIADVNTTIQTGFEFLRNDLQQLPDYTTNVIETLPKYYNITKKAILNKEFWLAVKNSSQYCRRHTTHILAETQVLNEIYKELVSCLLKGYMVFQFSYMILTARGVDNYQQRAEYLRDSFKVDVLLIQDTAKSLQQNKALRREMWACDLNDYSHPNSFVAITRFYQGFLASEINLNSRGDCKLTCSDYVYTWHFNCKQGTFCSNREIDRRQAVCNGTVQNCMYIESDLSVCMAPLESSRRYEFIKYGNGQVMGDGKRCPNKVTGKSWWDWFYKCDNCLCYCDDPGTPEKRTQSDRYISLRAAVSDIMEDKIVTGVSIVKIYGIIQLRIAQRKLLPRGVVDMNNYSEIPNSHWKTAELFKLDDENVFPEEDYIVISWANRSISLSSAIIDDTESVVTGVRFKRYHNVIRLEIRATKFNFENGHLDPSKCRWIGYSARLQPLAIHSPDVPTKSRDKSKPYEDNNYFVQFQPSDVEKDGAQTTIPYLDATPVEASIPLSGAGLYFKKQHGYGGFIGPKLIVFDFSTYLTPPSYNFK